MSDPIVSWTFNLYWTAIQKNVSNWLFTCKSSSQCIRYEEDSRQHMHFIHVFPLYPFLFPLRQPQKSLPNIIWWVALQSTNLNRNSRVTSWRKLKKIIIMDITIIHIKKILIYLLYMESETKFLLELVKCLMHTIHTYFQLEKASLETNFVRLRTEYLDPFWGPLELPKNCRSC